MLQAGTYKALKVLSAYIGESPEKKTAYFEIEFELENGETISWIAWLSTATDKGIAAANRHVETLKKLGYKSDKLSDMADEKKSIEDLFGKPEDEVKLVIEVETYGDHGDKERSVVKFVNVGEMSGLTKFDHKQAVAKFKSLPFDSTLKKLKAGEKLPPREKAEKKETPKNSGSDAGSSTVENAEGFGGDDLPF